MYTNPDEAAYCVTRIARSEALAAASIDDCARASHVGLAQAYGDRLTSLKRSLIHPRCAGAALVGTTIDA